MKEKGRAGRPPKVMTKEFITEIYESDEFLKACVEDFLRLLRTTLGDTNTKDQTLDSKSRDIKLAAFLFGSVTDAVKALTIINGNKKFRELFDTLTDEKVSPLQKYMNEKSLVGVVELCLTDEKDPNVVKGTRKSSKKAYLYEQLDLMKKKNGGKLPPGYEKRINQMIENKFGFGSAYQMGSIPRMLSRDRKKSNL